MSKCVHNAVLEILISFIPLKEEELPNKIKMYLYTLNRNHVLLHPCTNMISKLELPSITANTMNCNLNGCKLLLSLYTLDDMSAK